MAGEHLTTLLTRLRQLDAAATPGPWRWEINLNSKTVEICGGPSKGGFGRFDLSVMSFARWGLNSAAPKFWRWDSKGGWLGTPQRADELAVPVPGREHHARWFQAIDHPDAAAMVELRSLLPEIIAALERVEASDA